MHACSLMLMATALGVNSGWQPLEEGGMEYIVQIQPELFESMRAGEVITSIVPDGVEAVRSFKVVVGDERPPRIDPPVLRVNSVSEPSTIAVEAPSIRQQGNVLRTNAEEATQAVRGLAEETQTFVRDTTQDLRNAGQNIRNEVQGTFDRYSRPSPANSDGRATTVVANDEPSPVMILPERGEDFGPASTSRGVADNSTTTPFRVNPAASAPASNASVLPPRSATGALPDRYGSPAVNSIPATSQAQPTYSRDDRLAAPNYERNDPAFDRTGPVLPPSSAVGPDMNAANRYSANGQAIDNRYAPPRLDDPNATTTQYLPSGQDDRNFQETRLRDVAPRAARDDSLFTAPADPRMTTVSATVPGNMASADPALVNSQSAGAEPPAANIPGPANGAPESPRAPKLESPDIGTWGFVLLLLAGSAAGNFYMGYTWLAMRRRFHSLVRDRRMAV
ncbi:MAG: hypothetical protein KDA42_10715 [Planctomycetales bacterium]|nr:hypothetical protein [Planctomycetales bacterium]